MGKSVTLKVRELLNSGSFKVTNSHFGDPAPGNEKMLFLEVSFGTMEYKVQEFVAPDQRNNHLVKVEPEASEARLETVTVEVTKKLSKPLAIPPAVQEFLSMNSIQRHRHLAKLTEAKQMKFAEQVSKFEHVSMAGA